MYLGKPVGFVKIQMSSKIYSDSAHWNKFILFFLSHPTYVRLSLVPPLPTIPFSHSVTFPYLVLYSLECLSTLWVMTHFLHYPSVGFQHSLVVLEVLLPVYLDRLSLLTLKDSPLSCKSSTLPFWPHHSPSFFSFFYSFSYVYPDSNLVPPALKRIPLITTPRRTLLKTLISFLSVMPYWSHP